MWRGALLLAASWLLAAVAGRPQPAEPAPFSFAVAADVRSYAGPGQYDTSDYFRGAAQALAARGDTAFLFSPGDIDPPGGNYWTVTSTLGLAYGWVPVVGNHELPGAGTESYPGANLDWLRDYDYELHGPDVPPNLVNAGPVGCPETTFSFDYRNAHFVVLNEYCSAAGDASTDGDVPDHLYDWLAADLAATRQPHVFVVGHEPAFPLPDADNGRLRHENDSLNLHLENRDRFWALLRAHRVRAYICGHTHNYSAVPLDGVWQLDAGHARGQGDGGAPSTFLIVTVDGDLVRLTAYRDVHDGSYDYDDIVHSHVLWPYLHYLPILFKSSEVSP